MNVVDSSGWLEYFADGPAARFFAPVIEDVKRLVVPSVTILEVFKVALRQKGETEAIRVALQMHQGLVVPLGAGLARAAARYGLRLKLPLADSIIWATARAYDAVLWTQDAHFESLNPIKFIGRQ